MLGATAGARWRPAGLCLRMRRASWSWLIVAAWAAAVPALAGAQTKPASSGGAGANQEAFGAAADESAARDAEARHVFEAGRTAYDAGRYADALDYFQRGYALSQRPQLLYNVGQAADRLREDQTALDAFKLYLERLPNAENRPQVEERIRVLERVLAEKRSVPVPIVAPRVVEAPPPSAAAAKPANALATSAPPARDDESDDNVLNQWWFWAGAGGVVVTTVVLVAVLSGGESGGGGGEAPTKGSSGVTIAVLSLP